MPSLSIMVKPVSSQCNMRCSYCFYKDVAENRLQADYGRMSFETLDRLVRRAMAYADGAVSFAFQGGEPTLAGAAFYRTLTELQRKYNSKGLIVNNSIQTNGFRLDDDMAELLAREHFLVGVSYDGTPAIHDMFRKDAAGNGTSGRVEETIRKLSAYHIDFNILCVVNSLVAQNREECFANLSRFGYIQYIPCLDAMNGEKGDYSLMPELYTDFLKGSFDLYYDAFKAGKPVSIRNFDNYLAILLGEQPENCGMCGQCGKYYLVEADGSTYPCDFYVLDEWRTGNINDSSFFRLEKSEIGNAFISASLYVPEKCRSCRWYPLCRNGCRREREMTGDRINRWCACYSALFEYAFPRMEKMAEAIRKNRKA